MSGRQSVMGFVRKQPPLYERGCDGKGVGGGVFLATNKPKQLQTV